ncbi:MAG: efflux RND transporter permease subunit, partial [Flavobacteriaceae bacterium]|nr:efflux RND transporter permease subunit [Flavobacteriaceae bacterium]
MVKFFLENHKFTFILSIMIVVFGVMGLLKLNAESFPAVNLAVAQVITTYDGATAEDIETKITKPIEDKIRGVSGLKSVKSISKTGYSKIIVRVDMDNEDEDAVMDEVKKAVDEVKNLPSDLRADPTFIEINSEELPAVELAVVGDNTDRARDKVVDLLKEELEDSNRVKFVTLNGFRNRQFNIRLDEQKLAQYHIGVEELLAKIQLRNVSIPGGSLEKSGFRRLVRVEGNVTNAQELTNLVIRSNFSGKKVLLGDIADVVDGQEDASLLTSFNGRPATLMIVVKKAGADMLKLVDEVDDTVSRFRKQYAGQFEFPVFNNEAQKVKTRLEILSSNAFTGLALVIFFLFLFLPGKIGIVASISLPLAVMAVFGFMPMFGMSLNTVTILAMVIALGMLVDNSVVIAEHFARLRDHEHLSVKEAALKAVQQLWLPISVTALTTIAAFLPMLVTKNIMGQFIKFIPIIVSIALLFSLFESFFFLPMRLGWAVKNTSTKNVDSKSDWFNKFIILFKKFMNKMIQFRYLVFVAFGLILAGSVLLMVKGNRFVLFPPEQTEIYIGRIEMPRGSNLEQTKAQMIVLQEELQDKLGKWVKAITLRSGVSFSEPNDPKGSSGQNQGLFMIYASAKGKYDISHKKFLDTLRTVKSDVATSLTFEAKINGPPVGEPVNATFRSNNEK